MLPDGISDVELLQCKLPVDNILEAKVAPLRTSLAYLTSQRRVKVLVPIREYMQQNHPPLIEFVGCLLREYEQILEVCSKHTGTLGSSEIVPRLRASYANILSVLTHGLDQEQEYRTRAMIVPYLSTRSAD